MHPIDVVDVLDTAVMASRPRSKDLMACGAIALVPKTFLEVFLTRRLGSPFAEPIPSQGEVESAVSASFVLLGIEMLVITPFLTAAVSRASADVYLGHPVMVG